MRIRSLLSILGFSLAVSAIPASAQSNKEFWTNRWFWGAQGGISLVSADGTTEGAATVGGHWFITRSNTALQISFDQLFFSSATVTTPGGQGVEFDRMQRIQALLFAAPSVAFVNVFVGGGLAIHRITDGQPVGVVGPGAQFELDDLGTQAFPVFSAGVQGRVGARWVVYGQYQFTPGNDGFLLSSDQNTFLGGLRFSLTTSRATVRPEN